MNRLICVKRIFQLLSYILVFLCIFTRCDTGAKNCTFGSRAPKDLTRIQKLQDKRFSCEDTVTEHDDNQKTYVYNIGICVSADQPPQAESDHTQEAGAVQRDKGNMANAPTVIGNFTKADFREGADWIMLEYYGGKPYHHHCKNNSRMAVIMITCSPGKDGDLKVIEESLDDSRNCFYLFELQSELGCSSDNGKRLSVGSVIVIVFLSLVAVYVLFGMLFQRFVKGAKGLEQIPNYTFWRDAGNLSADGCDLVFRSHSTSDSREYRGFGGETLDQEIKRDSTTPSDDHLLAM